MRKKHLLTYGLLAGGAYLVYQHLRKSQAPAVVLAAPGAPAAGTVAGFGRLGYAPDGSDRPFAQHAGLYWRGRVR